MRHARSPLAAAPAMLAVLSLLAPAIAWAQNRPASPEIASLMPKLPGWSATEAPRS